MKITVDKDTCIGCGSCEAVCPECFEIKEDGKSHVKSTCPQNSECAKKAADICPVDAIIVE